MPPGIHLCAEVTYTEDGREQVLQLRILGDDGRGYLVSGLAALPAAAGEEFWFESLDEARRQAARFGVAETEWTEITDVGEVQDT